MLSNTNLLPVMRKGALYIPEGSIESEGTTWHPKQILLANDSKLCEFVMNEDTTIYIFGGHAFDETRIIYWNFVASIQELIEAEKTKWL